MKLVVVDNTSSSAPAPDQLEVGQFGFNSITGILYGKKSDGTIVKWPSFNLGDSFSLNGGSVALPIITFDNTGSLCCGGFVLTVIVNNLIVNNKYKLEISELSGNTSFTVSNYNHNLLPENSSQRSVMLNISMSSSNILSMVKFSIYGVDGSNQTLLSEKILNLTCSLC